MKDAESEARHNIKAKTAIPDLSTSSWSAFFKLSTCLH
jgi:hypothetical protein